ncbi:MAG: HPr(Ser) kinase/phosphatase [Kiritimatiellae bacterium]|nr:HPr(Ser) kinase/phosphatase [Kiritimatiellia bacterium]
MAEEIAKNKAPSFTLRQFVEAGGDRLKLSVVVDTGLDHPVEEPMMYRPGLALTGFFGHFAHKRIQVIGKAEKAYLESIGVEERLKRIRALFDNGAYCVVFAAGLAVTEEIQEIAREAGGTVLSSPLLTRNLFHAGTFVLETLAAPREKLYATTVEVAGLGVMMRGAPGLGKSETALGLIKHGNALVADDLTCLRKDVANNVLYASASPATRNYMEIRGIGIIHVPSVFGVTAVREEKRLDLVITFKRMEDVNGELDRAGEDRLSCDILGVDIPEIVIPVSAGRDLVNLVETAAQQHKLRTAGRDAAKELDEQLKRRAIS